MAKKPKSELEKQIAALPPNPKQAYKWTLEQDAMILKYIEEKGAEALGRVFGVKGIAVRRRHAHLVAKMKGAGR